MMSNESIRALQSECGVSIRGESRRKRWKPVDTNSVKALREKGLTIRDIALVARCSERTVQDVLKGEYDGH